MMLQTKDKVKLVGCAAQNAAPCSDRVDRARRRMDELC